MPGAKKKAYHGPQLSWGLSRLEEWWDKHGAKVEDEVWNESRRRYDKKMVVVDIDGQRSFCESFGALNGCCGIMEIGNFFTNGEIDGVPLTLEQKACIAAYSVLTDNDRDSGNFIGTTIKQQKDVEQILPLIGFKAIGTCIGPTTRNKITIWLATV